MLPERVLIELEDELLRVLAHVAGHRFIGALDAGGCVELVFAEPRGGGGRLVTIYTRGRRRGEVALGSIAAELLKAGYVRGA